MQLIRNLSIIQKLSLLILVSIVAILFTGLLGYQGVNSAQEKALDIHELNDIVELELRLNNSVILLDKNISKTSEVVTGGEDLEINTHQEEYERLNAQYDTLTGRLLASDVLRRNYASFDSLTASFLAFKEQSESYYRSMVSVNIVAIHINYRNYTEKLDKFIIALKDLDHYLETEKSLTFKEAEHQAEIFTLEIVLALFGLIVIILMFSLIILGSVQKSFKKVDRAVTQIAQGDLPELKEKVSNDELGKIYSGLKAYIQSLEKALHFSSDIGQGEFTTEFEPVGEKDKLGYSLLEMRDNLKVSAEKESARQWVINGIAELGSIMRNYSEEINLLCDKVLNFVVKYSELNQGALYIVDEVDGRQVLVLRASYAWGRRKFEEANIEINIGYVGQVFREKYPFYMNNIPEDYITIGSGLGGANPRSIYLVPLMDADTVVGVMEVASFHIIDEAKRDFIKTSCESVASSILNVQNNERTKRLLEDSQLLTEQMREQEEELKQNTEEMIATQEEMNRRIHQLEEELDQKDRG